MKHLILLSLFIISGCLYAQNEIYIAESVTDKYYYVESQLCESYLNRYKVWIKAVPRKPKIINKQTYTGAYDLQLFLIDYSSHQIGILKAITYNKSATKILNYKSFDEQTATLEDVIPGSVGAKIAENTYIIIHINQ